MVGYEIFNQVIVCSAIGRHLVTFQFTGAPNEMIITSAIPYREQRKYGGHNFSAPFGPRFLKAASRLENTAFFDGGNLALVH